MSDPNDEQLNDYMAEEIMGWVKVEMDSKEEVFEVWERSQEHTSDGLQLDVGEWYPSINLNQAVGCLESQDYEWGMTNANTGAEYSVSVFVPYTRDDKERDRVVAGDEDSLARAICLAIYRAEEESG